MLGKVYEEQAVAEDRSVLIVRQIGTVIQAGRGTFRRVRWEGGEVESFNIAELVPFSKGQRFEAMVVRGAWIDQYNRGWNFIRMYGVKPLEPFKPMTPEESQALWDSIPTSASLPSAPWNEID